MIKVGYHNIQTILDDEGTFTSEEKSPCIGRDALRGVYFHPAPAIGKKVTTRGTCIYDENISNTISMSTKLRLNITTEHYFIYQMCWRRMTAV